MNEDAASIKKRPDCLVLKRHEAFGLYALTAEEHAAELVDWLEEYGVEVRVDRAHAALPCGGACALVFGQQRAAWVSDALELYGCEVAFGDGVRDLEAGYPPEVERLLRLGDPCKKDFDYARMRLTREHVPALVHLAIDDELYDGTADGRREWAPVHAWRALGVLRAPEAAKPLIGLLWRVGAFDDEWVGQEVPDVLVAIGAPALGPLFAYFDRESWDVEALIIVAETIGNIGVRDPASRDVCVKGLTERLTRFDRQDDSVNAFLVAALADLKAVESLAVVEAAYASRRVDQHVMGDVEDARIAFGVQTARTTPRLPSYVDADDVSPDVAAEVGDILDDGASDADLGYDAPLDPYLAPEKIGRNAPCLCGSGKKFKKCCGKG